MLEAFGPRAEVGKIAGTDWAVSGSQIGLRLTYTSKHGPE